MNKTWKLQVDPVGRQTWKCFDDKETRQSFIEEYWLGTLKDETILPDSKNALDSARNGLAFFSKLQTTSGHFAGEYGGPMFLLPGLAIVMYITETPLPLGYTAEIIRYLRNRANKEDGGWGIHIEGKSTVFGTALNYVALRLLGVEAMDPVCEKARETLWKLGGAAGIPAWGKFWLSLLNVYDWDGNHSIPPELWILPSFLPIHPGKMWCHTRTVYMSMCYLYGKRFKTMETELIISLRSELYPIPYKEIHWSSQKDNVASVDLFCPPSRLMGFLNGITSIYEKLPIGFIRNIALEHVLKQIKMEDANTDYLDIGPVNNVMNMLIIWLEDGPDSHGFKKHVDRVRDFMWVSNQGMMMNGTNGSQVWDTAFAVQSVMAGKIGAEKDAQPMLERALVFLKRSQIRENVLDYEKAFRHISKGAWPFSTIEQGYTVSDSTAEGLKAVLMLQYGTLERKEWISEERLFEAVNVLLTMQNGDGGFASYERVRGPAWLELLNPAQVFGNIMIEYTYPECTTAVLLALSTFRKTFPFHRRDEIDLVVERCIEFIKKSQLPDGSWYGSWGICFTYATFFAVESLASIGETYETSENLGKACDFLCDHQNEDGGWGETYRSCEIGVWVNHETSQVVQTAWAVLSLMAAKYPNLNTIRNGIELIRQRQQKNGEWKQEGIEGVFNKNCMISYPNYKFIFCIWALNRFGTYFE